MARVTVEDCIEKESNRFNLVLKSARRARDIAAGARPFVEKDGDKETVMALREIAQGKVDLQELHDKLVQSFQRINISQDLPEEHPVSLTDSANAAMSELYSSMDVRDEDVSPLTDTQPGQEGERAGAPDAEAAQDPAVQAEQREQEAAQKGATAEMAVNTTATANTTEETREETTAADMAMTAEDAAILDALSVDVPTDTASLDADSDAPGTDKDA
ncbi:MAG: DNA-directed RNA polymerase subunit omega [Pseudomonadota bacterium]